MRKICIFCPGTDISCRSAWKFAR